MSAAQRIQSYNTSTGTHRLYVLDCWKCSEVYAITAELEAVRRRDGGTFYCPNGHATIFSAQKTVDQRRIEQLERDLSAAKQREESAHRQRAWAETQAKGAAIAAGKAKAKAARLLHRVECGTCPDCHRTFKQLAAHMLAKHGVTANAACGVGRDDQPRRTRATTRKPSAS